MSAYMFVKDGVISYVSNMYYTWDTKHRTAFGCTTLQQIRDKAMLIMDESGQFWHAPWLHALPESVAGIFPDCPNAVEIDDDEFEAISDILKESGTAEYKPPAVEEPEPEPEEPLEEVKDLSYLRELKISSLNKACNEAIVAGFSVALSDGETYRFTMKDEDQIAMMLLLSRAQAGEKDLDFYAADRKCLVLSNKDALKIGNAAVAYRSYHVAYYRCLADWIDSLNDASSIGAIEYGSVVPKEFRSGFLVRYATALGVSIYAEIS